MFGRIRYGVSVARVTRVSRVLLIKQLEFYGLCEKYCGLGLQEGSLYLQLLSLAVAITGSYQPVVGSVWPCMPAALSRGKIGCFLPSGDWAYMRLTAAAVDSAWPLPAPLSPRGKWVPLGEWLPLCQHVMGLQESSLHLPPLAAAIASSCQMVVAPLNVE